MASKKQVSIGVLLLIMLASGVLYVQFSDRAQIRIDCEKSTFYVKTIGEDGQPTGRWLVAGRELNKLYDGSSLIKRHLKDCKVDQSLDGDILTITRTIPYYNGGTIKDVYTFDSTKDDITQFPLTHEIKLLNANTCGSRGCIFQYEVRDLEYDGETRDATSPESFGKNMEVEWDGDAYYAKVSQQLVSDKLIVKYRVTEPEMTINVRLFDPPQDSSWSATATLNSSNTVSNLEFVEIITNQTHLLLNPSFENPIGAGNWTYEETDVDFTNGASVTPVNYNPTDGTNVLLLGQDTSNGQGSVKTLTTGTYQQVSLEVDLTNVTTIKFDQKIEAYDPYSTAYFEHEVLVNGVQKFYNDNTDYVANDTSIDVSAINGVKNITFRKTSQFTGGIYEPAWFIDNVRLEGSNSYWQQPIDYDLVGMYIADTSGATDHSYQSNNGTINLAVWNATGGYDGLGAYFFDGTNDYFNVPDQNYLDMTTKITLMAWVKPTATPVGTGYIFDKNNEWSFALTNGRNLRWLMNYPTLNFDITTTETLDLDTWYHVAATYDTSLPGGNAKVFINGVEVKNETETAPLQTNANNLRIGCYENNGGGCSSTSWTFTGEIDEVLIYNVSLTPTEIQGIYNDYTAAQAIKRQGPYYPISNITFPEINLNKLNVSVANLTASGTASSWNFSIQHGTCGSVNGAHYYVGSVANEVGFYSPYEAINDGTCFKPTAYLTGNSKQASQISALTIQGASSSEDTLQSCQNGGFVNGETYYLTQSITDSAGTCMTIDAPNVVLDCLDNTIDGTDSGDAIYVNAVENVTIQNCKIQQFEDGVEMFGAANGYIIQNNNITDVTDDGVYISTTADNGLIYNNYIADNIGSGDTGIYLSGSDNNNVSFNTLTNNYYSSLLQGNGAIGNVYHDNIVDGTYISLYLDSMDNAHVFDNQLIGTPSYGVYIGGGDGHTIQNNQVNGSSVAAFYFAFLSSMGQNFTLDNTINGDTYVHCYNENGKTFSGYNISQNKVTNYGAVNTYLCNNIIFDDFDVIDSDTDGFYIYSVSNITIQNSNISLASDSGIEVTSSDNVTFQHNYFGANADDAIYFFSNIDDVLIYNNTFKDQSGAGDSGIQVGSGNDRHDYLANTFVNNAVGIYYDSVDATDFTVRYNNFTLNTYPLYLTSGDNGVFVNNTFDQSTYHFYIGNTNADNNIFYRNNFLTASSGPGFVTDVDDHFNVTSLGNYWSVYDEVGEGCVDSNVDNICDSPFNITAGGSASKDFLPSTYPFYSEYPPIVELPNTIYVRKGGNDQFCDGSGDCPYASLEKAESVAVSGNQINVGPGTYEIQPNANNALTVNVNNIRFYADQPLQTQLKINSSSTNARIFYIVGANNVTMEGFVMNGTGPTQNASIGVYVSYNQDDTKIIGNKFVGFKSNADAIDLRINNENANTENTLIYNNTFEGFMFKAIDLENGNHKNLNISYNNFSNLGSYSSNYGIYALDSSGYNITGSQYVHNNEFYQYSSANLGTAIAMYHSGAVDGHQASDVQIYKNSFGAYGNELTNAIALRHRDFSHATIQNNDFWINNTIARQVVDFESSGASNNNIVFQHNNFCASYSYCDLTATGDLFYGADINNLVFYNNTAYVSNGDDVFWSEPSSFNVTNINFTKNTVYSTDDSMGHVIGIGNEGRADPRVYSGCVFENNYAYLPVASGGTTHSLFIGDTIGCSIKNNYVLGGEYGIGLKGNDNPLVYNNTVVDPALTAIYDKSSYNANISYNHINMTNNGTYAFNAGGSVGSFGANSSFMYNNITTQFNVTKLVYFDGEQTGAVSNLNYFIYDVCADPLFQNTTSSYNYTDWGTSTSQDIGSTFFCDGSEHIIEAPVGGAGSCGCPSPAANWNIGTDMCVLQASCNVTGFNLTFSNSTIDLQLNGTTVYVASVIRSTGNSIIRLNNGSSWGKVVYAR